MSYIQLFIDDEVQIPIGDTTPTVMSAELDSEPFEFAAALMTAVAELEEDKVLIIRKVIF